MLEPHVCRDVPGAEEVLHPVTRLEFPDDARSDPVVLRFTGLLIAAVV